MLRSVNELYNFVLEAQDGEIGRCKDFLFDDERWTVRYMAADTGKWLPGRKVLISPISLGEPGWFNRRFEVKLTKEQIENSPPLDSDAPVSRQFETKWFAYYGYPYYWGGVGIWGGEPYPGPLFLQKGVYAENEPEFSEDNIHTRSAKEVIGYHIQAADDKIGHVEDFLLEDDSWTIRYMVVDTRNWLPGRKVLVTPAWIEAVDWSERKVHVDLTKDQIKESPEYDPSSPVMREYEERLYEFYGRPGYWT